jgi:glyoxylase-like metal-dependent hydrolase (beta-lactamase superfamily II)
VAIERLAGRDVTRVRADNPSPLTLDGSNSWVAGRDPCWVIDPGPGLPAHLQALCAEVERRGGLGGIALTHRHADHAEAVPGLRQLAGRVPVAAATGDADVPLADGERFGPLTAVSVPGHSPDHLAFVTGPVCFTGDAVLGRGSVFISPEPGAMSGYLSALRRLRAMELELLCPGHGPPVPDANAKLDEYLEHRLDRERHLVAALERGLRTEDDLLDAAWSDAPPALRPAAALTLRAHLHKLREEGRLPAGVQVRAHSDAHPAA